MAAMAADVSCLVQSLGRYKEEGEGDAKAGNLVTRDLLGVCAVTVNQELDLDLKDPTGWEKRFDLVSAEVSCQPASTGNTDKLQDLNIPPLFPTFTSPPNLDLKLFPPSSYTSTTTTFHHSVCTLDKVKSALERAAKSKPHIKPERSISPACSSITTTNSKRACRSQGEEEVEEPRSSALMAMGEAAALMAAGCPSCLSYVLVSRDNPLCPRCCSGVPLPARKKPKIELDLNSDTVAGAPPAIAADVHL